MLSFLELLVVSGISSPLFIPRKQFFKASFSPVDDLATFQGTEGVVFTQSVSVFLQNRMGCSTVPKGPFNEQVLKLRKMWSQVPELTEMTP